MIKDYKVLVLIPARGGSKRIPKKNIKLLGGKPLIAYTVEQGKSSQFVDRLVVSTDDEEIAQVAKDYGAEVPFMRPRELAGDEADDRSVFLHALEWFAKNENYLPDIVVHLRPTHPLRRVEHIDRAIELLASHPEADSVRSVKEPDQTPYKMYKIDKAGFLEPLLTLPGISESFNLPRQTLPKTFEHVGVVDAVWYRTLMGKKQMSGSKIIPLVFENYFYSGINTLEDWEKYECWIQKR